MVETDKPVRQRTKVSAVPTAHIIAFGHLNPGYSRDDIVKLTRGRVHVEVPAEPVIEHRWGTPSDDGHVELCEKGANCTIPVTVLLA